MFVHLSVIISLALVLVKGLFGRKGCCLMRGAVLESKAQGARKIGYMQLYTGFDRKVIG